MSLRSDSPGSKHPPAKLVVVDAKKSTWTSYEGRAVASKVAVVNPPDDSPESVKNFKEDLEGFRASAVAGTDAKLDKEEEVFLSRYGYANEEVKKLDGDPEEMKEVFEEVLIEVPHTLPFTQFTLPPGSGDFSGHPDFTALRIVFLDIDGVLNSTKTSVVTGKIPYPNNGPIVLDLEGFDPLDIELINKLCESTNSVIVLSSSWRLGFDATQVQTVLDQIGINSEYVLGKTAGLPGVRGNEIDHFLRNIEGGEDGLRHLLANGLILPEYSNLEKVKVFSYAIIDDDSDMLENHLPHFVHVNSVEGFSLSDAIYAGRILTKSPTYGLKNLSMMKDLN